MKRTVLYILVVVFIMVSIIYLNISNAEKQQREASYFNKEYEMYLNKELSGANIATIINKATENNEKNSNPKDKKGFYIDNGENTIKVELKMISYNEEDEIVYNTYQMEAIKGIGITAFMQNYNTAKFTCSNIEYHKKTGQVSKIIIKEME